jgi:hypothetical protein
MPHIVDYALVLEKLLGRGLVSLYHNSGAFGFPRSEDVKLLGWIGPDDGSIRTDLCKRTRRVPEPHAATLAHRLVAAREILAGEAWLMPKSHWHFELHDGHPRLLESLLPAIGIEPSTLRDRNDGSAIAFSIDDDDLLRHTTARLLGGMRQSDFSIVFPEAASPAIVTLHHHRQIWWQTIDVVLIAALDALVQDGSGFSEFSP